MGAVLDGAQMYAINETKLDRARENAKVKEQQMKPGKQYALAA